LLRPPQDLWAGKKFALVVKNKAHAQAVEHLLSRGAMPVESDVTAQDKYTCTSQRERE